MAGQNPIIILGHALKQARVRGISEAQIRETVSNPDERQASYPCAKTRAKRDRYFKRFGKVRICVVVEYGNPANLVITTFKKEA
jgi:hypothetical protein